MPRSRRPVQNEGDEELRGERGGLEIHIEFRTARCIDQETALSRLAGDLDDLSVVVDGDHLLLCGFGGDDRVVQIRMERLQISVQQHIPVADCKIQPEAEHPPVRFRDALQTDRDLRNAEENIQKLKRGGFGGVRLIPFQHVGMDRGIAGGQTQIQGADPVGKNIGGAVSGPEHVAVLADRGADVALAEFNQNLRFQRAQAAHGFGKKKIHRVREGFEVASRIVFRDRGILSVKAETVDEVQLEPVKIPFPDRRFIGVDEVFADFRKTRIKNGC